MAKSYMGAMVQFCGHDGCFVADIFLVEGANVIVANKEVSPDKLLRPAAKHATHRMSDFPNAGAWKPHRGFFVIPENQVEEII